MFITDILKPDTYISALENRVLNQFPTFSTDALLNNQWTKDYGEYVRDQFILRDWWMKEHSFIEQYTLAKLEIGDVWLAKNEYLMAKAPLQASLNDRVTQANIRVVCNLAKQYPGRVYVMIVPSASNILSGYLRFNPPHMDENAAMDMMFKQFSDQGVHVIDLRDDFLKHSASGEQLYYRTDHHWTTDGGALLAYEEFCGSTGRAPIMPDAGSKHTVDGFLGTNYAKTLSIGITADKLIYYDFHNPISIEKRGSDGSVSFENGSIMDYDKLSAYDKYAAFLRGNNGYSYIEGNGSGSVLLIKDSYGNCFAPFLIQNYKNIGIIDLRARQTINDIVKADSDILVLYSFQSFIEDVNLMRLAG